MVYRVLDDAKKQKLKVLKKVLQEERARGKLTKSEADRRIKEVIYGKEIKPTPSAAPKPQSRPQHPPQRPFAVGANGIIPRKRPNIPQPAPRKAQNSRPIDPKRQKTPEKSESKKPIQIYYCKRCDRKHELDYHKKQYELKRQREQQAKQPVMRKSSSGSQSRYSSQKYASYYEDEEDSLDGFIEDDIEDQGKSKDHNIGSNILKLFLLGLFFV